MNMTESVHMGMRSLSANKMRSLLTMLGIIIGTGAVIALLSVGQGAQRAISSEIESIGSNLIFVFPGSSSGSESRYEPLTAQDAEAIADLSQTQYVAAAAPELNRGVTLTYRGDTASVSLSGTTPEYEYVRSLYVEYGRFISESDDSTSGRVVVLGYKPASDFFGDPESALGQTIRINQVPFQVIGVLEEKGGGSLTGSGTDNVAIVPLSTAQRRLFADRVTSNRGRRIDMIYVSAVDAEHIDEAIEEITWLLRERLDIEFEEDTFTVASQKDILGVFDQITGVLTIFLGAIAAISLLVGGIGIMNIMLVSVTERTREIGIRKAVGAKNSDILWQFLVESIILSLTGGAVGILFGWGVSLLVNQLGAFETFVSPQAITLAVGFSMAVGLFFGVYPASRAANLRPIEALRYE